MTSLTAKDGSTRDYTLDLDALCAYEEANPKYSVFIDFQGLASLPRMSTIVRLAGFVGIDDWMAFVKLGFGLEDLATIYSDAFEELGFSASSTQPEEVA